MASTAINIQITATTHSINSALSTLQERLGSLNSACSVTTKIFAGLGATIAGLGIGAGILSLGQSALSAAEAAKNVLDPVLDAFKNDPLGDALKKAYSAGSIAKTKAGEVELAISAIADTKEPDAYGKILKDAEDKAKRIGEQVRKFDEYQKKANKTAAEYGAEGEKTRQLEDYRASTLKRIADLQEKIVRGKADEDTQGEIDRLKDEMARRQAAYQKGKQRAIAAAKEAADQRANVEMEAEKSIEAVRMAAEEKLTSRQTALSQAKLAQEKAMNATSLADYMAMMEEKDAVTGESYAAILAQEQALHEQRQVWHEQLMLNAMEWSDYMSATFTSLNEQLIGGLSGGLAQSIAQGKSLADMFSNLATNLLQNLINNVLKKWLTSLIGIGAQGKINAAQETANAARTIAVEHTKTPILTQNAIAASITARPIVPAAATAAEVLGAVSMGKAAAFAAGGLVVGAGTAQSDSIPAMLSNGEFVMRAEAVNRLGTDFLYALNSGESYHYANGGEVGAGNRSGEGAASPGVTVNVSALDTSSFETFLLHGGLDTIRQALYDNNRNFGATAGVF